MINRNVQKKKILLIMKLNFFGQMLGKISEMKHFNFLLALCVSLTRQKNEISFTVGKKDTSKKYVRLENPVSI